MLRRKSREGMRPMLNTRITEIFETGNLDAGTWLAGVSAGLVHDLPSVDELVSRIVADAEAIIGGRLVGMAD